MLGGKFLEVQGKYEVAKICVETSDFKGLGEVCLEIDEFWKDNAMTMAELEYVDAYEKIIDRCTTGIVERCLAPLWGYAMDGNLSMVVMDGGDRLEYLYGLRGRKILSRDVMRYAKGQLRNIERIARSSLQMSLLEDFSDACLREDGNDIKKYLDEVNAFTKVSSIKGPCRGN